MNKKLILPIIMLIILSVSASAVKPAVQVSSSGLIISYPKAQAYIYGQDFDLYFHVFNGSNWAMGNNTLNCSIHIYNETNNKHIVTDILTYDDHYDWEYKASNATFTKTGFYPYIVWCNSSTGERGYLSDEILISVDGEGELTTNNGFLAIAIILLPLLFSFLLMKWVNILGESHEVFRLSMSLLSLLLLFASLWFATMSVLKFFLWPEMVESLATITSVFGWLMFAIFSYFIIVMIYNIFKGIGKRKEEKFEL